jgi:putative phage-type endonuclease
MEVCPKVAELLKIPKLEQKSEEWYEARANMITASDFAQALGEGKFGTQKQLIEKKCTPREANEGNASRTNPFFKWGNTFEPVAIAIYSALQNKTVFEFGLIKHPQIPFFGASPDGITHDGIMVEIKCPYRRKLDGEVPRQYYYQIQGQLDVCDLDECDYFECTFAMLSDLEEFKELEGSEGFIARGCYRDDNGVLTYQEPFIGATSGGNERVWTGSTCRYWVAKQYNLKRVTRDPSFLTAKFKELEDVWNKIVYYRQNKDAFMNEVVQEQEIKTEPFKKQNNNMFEQYMFRDL